MDRMLSFKNLRFQFVFIEVDHNHIAPPSSGVLALFGAFTQIFPHRVVVTHLLPNPQSLVLEHFGPSLPSLFIAISSALQLASQLYIVMSEFGSTLLLVAIFLQLSQVHLALQLSPLHKQEVNQLVLMHLTCGHKPSPAEQFRVTSPSRSM